MRRMKCSTWDLLKIWKPYSNQSPQKGSAFCSQPPCPQPIMNIARRYMRNPEKIRVNMQDVVIPKIKQIFYEVREAG